MRPLRRRIRASVSSQEAPEVPPQQGRRPMSQLHGDGCQHIDSIHRERDRKLRGDEQPVSPHPVNWFGIGCISAFEFVDTQTNELA